MDNVKNFAKTRLNGSVSGGDGTITVDDGSVFPAAPFNIVVFDETTGNPADDSGAEIMHVTDVSSNILTVDRGQENTSDVAHDNNEIVFHTVTAKDFNNLYSSIFRYGVSWDESTSSSACSKVGSSNLHDRLPIQNKMKRCVINNSGEVQYYLHPNDSHNKELVQPSITGSAESTTDIRKLVDTGQFGSDVVAGHYVKNTTQDTYAMIESVDSSDQLTLKPRVQDTRTWGSADTDTTDHLVDSTADFTGDGVQVGDIAWNRDTDSYAKVTNVTATDLTLDSDIFPSGNEKYSVMPDIFAQGDNYEVCTAVLNGDDGQVVVEIPKFYYKYSYSGTTHEWQVSEYPLDGFDLHPAFYVNGEVKDFAYVGAFEAAWWDDSAGDYVQAVGTPDSADRLDSVAGEFPAGNATRAEFRDLANNRGSGWFQQSFYIRHAVQLLFLIEYRDWNSQDVLGEGATDWSSSNWNDYNGHYAVNQAGWSLKDGNDSANSTQGGDELGSYVTYRGIENFYGNIWKWVDGMNINDNHPYVTNNPSNFGDDTKSNYVDLGVDLPASNGYQVTLEQVKHGFLPASVGGSSSTYITDYYWENSGWRVARAGGNLAGGDRAGFACSLLHNGSGNADPHIGARVCFRK